VSPEHLLPSRYPSLEPTNLESIAGMTNVSPESSRNWTCKMVLIVFDMLFTQALAMALGKGYRAKRFPNEYGLDRSRANSAHLRQPRPKSGPGFQEKVLDFF
jgi:hypothetical protein